ncbi:hypothetical protein C7S17_0379 [Burkholderia thailandensis]|nr:hypothetical protein [Burkholderia thailandensis]
MNASEAEAFGSALGRPTHDARGAMRAAGVFTCASDRRETARQLSTTSR